MLVRNLEKKPGPNHFSRSEAEINVLRLARLALRNQLSDKSYVAENETRAYVYRHTYIYIHIYIYTCTYIGR